jgi:hypothetical protein
MSTDEPHRAHSVALNICLTILWFLILIGAGVVIARLLS